jgi:DnaJ-class molecular chaperone
VKIPTGTQNDEKIKVNREGFYKLNSTEKGNMIITVKVKLPKSVTEEEKALYEELRKVAKEGK